MRISKTILWQPSVTLFMNILHTGSIVNCKITFQIIKSTVYENKYYLISSLNNNKIFGNSINQLKEAAQNNIEELAQQIVFTKVKKQIKADRYAIVEPLKSDTQNYKNKK